MSAETPERPEAPPQEPPARIPGWVKIAIVFALLVGGVAFLLVGGGADDALSYSKLVDEVVDEPAAFAGRKLRVEGELKEGSVQFREDPCQWRFVLTKKGREMPVEFPQCVVPDTFQDGMGISVVVEGKIDESGAFTASQVIPRCPSKYEMKQKAKSGEQAPHQVPSSYEGELPQGHAG